MTADAARPEGAGPGARGARCQRTPGWSMSGNPTSGPPGTRRAPRTSRWASLATGTLEIPQDGPVYLICRSGARSNRAAHALAGAGWDAVNVSDGMQGWAAAGRPMTNDSGTPPYVA